MQTTPEQEAAIRDKIATAITQTPPAWLADQLYLTISAIAQAEYERGTHDGRRSLIQSDHTTPAGGILGTIGLNDLAAEILRVARAESIRGEAMTNYLGRCLGTAMGLYRDGMVAMLDEERHRVSRIAEMNPHLPEPTTTIRTIEWCMNAIANGMVPAAWIDRGTP